jgi:hypothetical protein
MTVQIPVEDHRQMDVFPYYVKVRVQWRDGQEEQLRFDTFESALRHLSVRNEEIEYQSDLQTITIDCISAEHRRTEV